MKKIITFTLSIILLLYTVACAGYKPIFNTSKFNFKIENYSLIGDERLAKLIYKKLYNISQANKNNLSSKGIVLLIETKKNKKATVKNNVGKVLEYKINLSTSITINDFLTEKKLLNQIFNYSTSYKVQEVHSETVKLENKNIENLVDKTYQEVLIKISEVITLE